MDTPADVVIVGAGASGGVVARRLAEAGIRVTCLEQGDWPDPAAYRGAHDDWELTALKRFAWNPNVRGLPEDYPVDLADSDIDVLMYNAVGGSMQGYAAHWPRFAASDFRVRSLDGVADDWPLDYAELRPFFDRTDRDFGISGLAGDPALPDGGHHPPLPPLPIGEAGRRVARAHNELGWHWWPAPNAIASRNYGPLKACVRRGTCPWGCPHRAKGTTDLTHWPAAVAAGAQLVTGARATRIAVDARGHATGVEYLDRDGREHVAAGAAVVLAANGIGTPRLLLMSASSRHPDGLANSSGLVGRRLMLHPFATVAGVFEEPLADGDATHWGQSIQSMQFYETDESRGFVRGAKWGLLPTGGPLLSALAPGDTPAWGAPLQERVRDWVGQSAMFGLIAEDLPEERNRVTLSSTLTDSDGLPAVKVDYRVSENSRRLLAFHAERASESLTAAGARDITVTLPDRGTGWHLLGTARMGDDPRSSVVDHWGRAHDVPNLFVVDGSTFVTSAGVNPTATIVALALRTADHILESKGRPEAAHA